MGIQVGKTPVIFDDDPRLAAVWKGANSSTEEVPNPFPFSSYGDGGGPPPPPPPPGTDRPQLSDILFKGFEPYDDALGMQRVKAKFRIYNSSKEQIDGFLFALTKPDTQGGRS
jgi:hypothetical protein